MIYLAGENNLAEECVWALKEIRRAMPRNVAPDGKRNDVDNLVRIVAQLDAGGLGGNENRYILKRGDNDGVLNHDKITERDTSEQSYRSVLKDFISSSLILNPRAEKYCLILSGHGKGIMGDFLAREVEAPDGLSIPKIRWVLEEAKKDITERRGREFGEDFKIDLIGLDSCMMSMVEIGYELRNYARYMVGAEGFESNFGWPYERVITELLTDPLVDARTLATKIVELYINYYSDFLPAGRSVDQAACDLSKCDALGEAVKNLANVLSERLAYPDSLRQIVLAHWEAQSYKDDQYVDLFDFCDLLSRGSDENSAGSIVMRGLEVNDNIVEACNRVKATIAGEDGLVVKSCYSGPAVQYSHGASLYFPWAYVIESYRDLEFAQATNWKDFLMKYVEMTRRKPRPCEADPNAATVKSELFFSPAAAGFEFILTNKDAPELNRMLGNKVGSMKNPALEFVRCKCGESDDPDSTVDKLSGDNTTTSVVEEPKPKGVITLPEKSGGGRPLKKR